MDHDSPRLPSPETLAHDDHLRRVGLSDVLTVLTRDLQQFFTDFHRCLGELDTFNRNIERAKLAHKVVELDDLNRFLTHTNRAAGNGIDVLNDNVTSLSVGLAQEIEDRRRLLADLAHRLQDIGNTSIKTQTELEAIKSHQLAGHAEQNQRHEKAQGRIRAELRRLETYWAASALIALGCLAAVIVYILFKGELCL